MNPMAIAAAMQVGGSMFSALSSFEYGDAAEKAGAINAAELRKRGGLAMASATREAYDVDLQAKYTASRAIALAAASGGGASDPSVVNLIAENAGQAAYKKAVALWEGGEQQRQMQYAADVSEYEGKMKKSQAYQRGISSIMQGGAAAMYGKYGGGGPKEGGS